MKKSRSGREFDGGEEGLFGGETVDQGAKISIDQIVPILLLESFFHLFNCIYPVQYRATNHS